MNALFQENPLGFDLPTLDLTRFSKPQTSQFVGEKYLVFFIGKNFYAVSSKKVVEAAPSLPVTVLPNSPEWLLGIVNLRGEVISVVNLPLLLRGENPTPALKQKFIILRSEFFEFGAAFAADRISEIVTLPSEDIEFDAAEKSPYIFGKAAYKNQFLNLIDTEKLLSSLTIN